VAAPGTQIYQFRGGAASWFGTQILGVLITVFTLGICYLFAIVRMGRWRAKNPTCMAGNSSSWAEAGGSSDSGSSGCVTRHNRAAQRG
jgi:uncharacterized membrane protein YjgN (DUF898 family)